MNAAIITAVDSLLVYAQSHLREVIALTRRLAECESPSDDPAALGRCADLISDTLAPFAAVKRRAGGHLTAEFHLPGRKKTGRILALGHYDTVWPLGTLAGMPVEERDPAGGRPGRVV
jgi:glutamate carboxypeptidase